MSVLDLQSRWSTSHTPDSYYHILLLLISHHSSNPSIGPSGSRPLRVGDYVRWRPGKPRDIPGKTKVRTYTLTVEVVEGLGQLSACSEEPRWLDPYQFTYLGLAQPYTSPREQGHFSRFTRASIVWEIGG